MTGNSAVRNIRCIDNRNQNDIDTLNSRRVCEISTPRDNTARSFITLGLQLDEVWDVT